MIEGCIRDGVLSGFLKEHKEAVIMQSIWAYDAEAHEEAIRDDAYEEGFESGKIEGRSEGHKQGILETLYSLVNDNLINSAEAAKRAGVTETAFAAGMKKMYG